MTDVLLLAAAAAGGTAAGLVTGLTPALHVNLVAAVLAGYAAAHPAQGLYLAVFILSLSIAHVFLEFIPSVFLGAPGEETALAALPAHRMLREGQGLDAVRLLVLGGICGLLALMAATPLLFFLSRMVFALVSDRMGLVLAAVASYLVYREGEANRRFFAALTFLLSGILGLVVLNSGIASPLTPMLSGLFGLSILCTSWSRAARIPPQGKLAPGLGRGEGVRAVSAGTLAGCLVGVFPALGPAQASILGMGLARVRGRAVLVVLGSVATVSMAFSLVTILSIGKARNGSIVVLEQIVGAVTPADLLLMFSVALLVAGLAALITVRLSGVAAALLERANYRAVALAVAGLIALVAFLSSGLAGIAVLPVAAAIGLVPSSAGVGRHHAMGCLILPVIVYYMF